MARTKKQEMEKEARKKVQHQQQKPPRELKSKKSVSITEIYSEHHQNGGCRCTATPLPPRITRGSASKNTGDGAKGRECIKEATLPSSKKEEDVNLICLQCLSSHNPVSASCLAVDSTCINTAASDDSSPSPSPASDSDYRPHCCSAKGPVDSQTAWSMTSDQKPSVSLTSHVNLPKAFVRVEDICKSSSEDVFKMMKRQLKKDEKGGASSDGVRSDSSAREENGASRKKSATHGVDLGAGDKTVSSSSTSSSKNIFEQFDTEIGGRKSPRRLSVGPRGSLASSSCNQENVLSRSSSEEKQHLSVASAVKALRGLSEKVSEGKGRNDCVNTPCSGRRSRENSPRTSSPRKQSPRRSDEKRSPHNGGSKTLKARKTNSVSPASDYSDSSRSPANNKRVRSPRRQSPDMTAGSPALPWKPCSSRGKDPGPSFEPENKSDKTTECVPKIHILSSTSRHLLEAKTGEVCAKPHSETSRQLFPNSGSEDKDTESKTKDLSHVGDENMCVDNTDSKVCQVPQKLESNPDTAQIEAPTTEEAEPSLLCAMLVGGSEVTKSYEQSREQNTQPGATQHTQSAGLTSSTPIRSHLSDCFFDEDSLPEAKPFELPVLSQLPPLVQPNMAVLELTKTEKPPASEQTPLLFSGQDNKTSSLLSLISKLRNCLQLSVASGDEKPCAEAGEDTLSASGSQTSMESLPSEANSYTVLSSTSASSSTDCTRTKSSDSLNTSSLMTEAGSEISTVLKAGEQIAAGEIVEPDMSHSCTSFASETRDLRMDSDTCAEKRLHAGSETHLKQSCQTVKSDSPQLSNGREGFSDLFSENINCPVSAVSSKDWSECDDERPGSPGSLGELDTAEITKSATQAVQSGLMVHDDSKDRSETQTSTEQVCAWQPSLSRERILHSQNSKPSTSEDCSHSIIISAAGVRASAGNSPSSSKWQPRSGTRPGAPSPLRRQWQPKIQPTENNGLHVWSRSHSVVSPSPLNILARPVKNLPNQSSSAFFSRDLDQYLHNPANRVTIPASSTSKLAKAVFSQGKYRDYEELQQVIRKVHAFEKDCSDDDEMLNRSDEEEEDHDDEKDFELSKKVDPDFDVLDGLVFASFNSEMAMQAHVTVEKVLKWDREPVAFVNIAKFRAFEESRRAQGNIRRESQGLRGVHMRWRKYQRLYRRELKTIHDERGLPWLYGKVLEKTSDVSKIKNWKKKFGEIKTEDGHESAGEENQQKTKRKRKTYIFSTKKRVKRPSAPADKGPTVATPDTSFDDTKIEDAEDIENLDTSQEIEEGEYGCPIPIDEDDYMDVVQSSLAEMTLKQHGLKNTRGIFSRLNMGPEDRHIFKKLGGWVTRLRMYKKRPKDQAGSAPNKTSPDEESKITHSISATNLKDNKVRKPSFSLPLISWTAACEALSALQLPPRAGLRTSRRSSGSNDASRLSARGDFGDAAHVSDSPELGAEKSCDKPGCRYGCICHLCQPSGESDEQEQAPGADPQKRTCDKEYCRLGCICDSLEKSSQHSAPTHCRRPECVLQCQCSTVAQGEDVQPLTNEVETPKGRAHAKMSSVKTEEIDVADSSGDELPTLEKTTTRRQRTTDRYSNLPRRETSYRVAKNLDAISRKAMMLYETSEIYWEQSSNRRKKSLDPNTSPPRAAAAAAPGTPSTRAAAASVSPATPATPVLSSSTPPASALESTVSPPSRGLSFTGLSSEVCQKSTPSTRVRSESASFVESSNLHPPEHPAVLISDEEASDAKLKTADSKFESRRSRSKRRMFSGGPDTGPAVSVAPKLETLLSPPTGRSEASKPPLTAKQEALLLPLTDRPEASKPPFTAKPEVLLLPLAAKPEVASSSSVTSASHPAGVDSTPANHQTAKIIPNPNFNRWHTSMVCLKANPVPKGKDGAKQSASDDVLEEDEIKLLEFITNCNWDRAKREILFRVAGCLTRGHYPFPRVMLVDDFRVEILAKASKPSVIPLELRNRLPEMMFSIRVRVTQYKNFHLAVPVSAVKNTIAQPPVNMAPGAAPVLAMKMAPPQGNMIGAAPHTDMKPGESMGISGLGHLHISQNKTVVPEMQASGVESFRFQAEKDNHAHKAEDPSADSSKILKQKKKKRKKKKTSEDGKPAEGEEDKTKPTVPQQNVQGFVGGSKPLSQVTPSTHSNIPQGFPLNKSVIGNTGKAQLLGVPAGNIGDIKFIQLPGQGGILQLVPASALGLKATCDAKGVPNYVAVPLTLTPIGKKAGSSAQAVPPVGQVMLGKAVTPLLSVGADTPDGDATQPMGELQAKRKKRKKKKKLLQDGEKGPSISGDNATNASALASAMQGLSVDPTQSLNTTVPEAETGGVASSVNVASSADSGATHNSTSVAASLASQASPQTLHSGHAQSLAEVATVSSSVMPGPGQSSATTLGTEAGAALTGTESPKSNPQETASSSAALQLGSAETLEPLSVSAAGQISDSRSCGEPAEAMGAGKWPVTSGSSVGIVGPSLPASQIPAPARFSSGGQPDVYPVHLVKNKMAHQDNSCGSGSSFSDDDIEIIMSEEESELDQNGEGEGAETQPSVSCPQCYYSNVGGKIIRVCDVCENMQLKEEVARSRDHKQRERMRRARHANMFEYLKQTLYATDPTNNLAPTLNVSKANLLSKAALVVKYQQRLGLSLSKGMNVESKRNALLQRQLQAKIESLRKEGVCEEAISAILSSVRPSPSPRVSPTPSGLPLTEEPVILKGGGPGSVPPSPLAFAGSAPRKHSVSGARPWQVETAGSDGSSGEPHVSVPSSESPGCLKPRNSSHRRKTSKPSRWSPEQNSEFVIEIERAEEDEDFYEETDEGLNSPEPAQDRIGGEGSPSTAGDTIVEPDGCGSKMLTVGAANREGPGAGPACPAASASSNNNSCPSPVHPASSSGSSQAQQMADSNSDANSNNMARDGRAVSGTVTITSEDRGLSQGSFGQEPAVDGLDPPIEDSNTNSEIVVPVITSVTSLQDADFNFGDGDIEECSQE